MTPFLTLAPVLILAAICAGVLADAVFRPERPES